MGEWAELVANQLTQKLLIKLINKKSKLGFYKISEACLPMICYSLLAIQSYLLNCNLVLIDGCIPNNSWSGIHISPILWALISSYAMPGTTIGIVNSGSCVKYYLNSLVCLGYMFLKTFKHVTIWRSASFLKPNI